MKEITSHLNKFWSDDLIPSLIEDWEVLVPTACSLILLEAERILIDSDNANYKKSKTGRWNRKPLARNLVQLLFGRGIYRAYYFIA